MIRVLLLLLAAGAAGAAALPLAQDYSALPPDPAAIEAELRAGSLQLAAAIAAAEKETGGVARSAELALGGEPGATVRVYAAGSAWNVSVGAGGQVVSKVNVPRLPGDPVSGAWTETPSGLKYYDLRSGDGEQPQGPSTRVKVHYSGWLVDGKLFDSSVKSGRPAEFPLDRVISGWTEGVGSMRVGGKRKLIIPYDLAYGPMGQGPIPPKATLIFDVELLEIVPQ